MGVVKASSTKRVLPEIGHYVVLFLDYTFMPSLTLNYVQIGARGREWCPTFYYSSKTGLIKPGLRFVMHVCSSMRVTMLYNRLRISCYITYNLDQQGCSRL